MSAAATATNGRHNGNTFAPIVIGNTNFFQSIQRFSLTNIMTTGGPLFKKWPFSVYLTYKKRNAKVIGEPASPTDQPTYNQLGDAQLTSRRSRSRRDSGISTPMTVVHKKIGHHLRDRDLGPHFTPNYVEQEGLPKPVILKQFYFRFGWFFWFVDKMSLIFGRKYVFSQPRVETSRVLSVENVIVDKATFVKVEVTATSSAIDPPIVPKTAKGLQAYCPENSTEMRIQWFIQQCRFQHGMTWDDGCMSIDEESGIIRRVHPCKCGGKDHRQIQLLLGISMLFPLYMARKQIDSPPDLTLLASAVDSIQKDTENFGILEEAVKQIYDEENRQRIAGNTKKCAQKLSVYFKTLKSIVTDPELNDSDFFVARWRLSPDNKSATQSLIKAARNSTDRRDKISVIYLLLTYRGLYPADSIAILGRSISAVLLDDILEKLDVQTMRFPVDGYKVTKNNLAKDMNPLMTDCGAYDTYFDVIGSQRVLVSLSSTVRRTDQYLELWQSFSVKGAPYSDRSEGVVITLAILLFNLSPLYWMRHSNSTLDYYTNVANQGSYFIAVTALLLAVATSWRSHGCSFHDMIVGKKHSTKLSHLLRQNSMYDNIPFFLKMVAHYESEHAPFLNRKYNSYMLPGKKGPFELDCVFTIKDLVDAGYKILQTSDRVRSDSSVDRYLWVDFTRSKEARDFELCKEGRRMIVGEDKIIKVSTKETALRKHMATSYSDMIVV